MKRIWFPLIVVCVISLHAIGMDVRPKEGDPGFGFVSAEAPRKPDTIRYRNLFKKKGGTGTVDTSSFLYPIDTTPALSARDTIFPPDSLKETDPFRYKYYVALIDSLGESPGQEGQRRIHQGQHQGEHPEDPRDLRFPGLDAVQEDSPVDP